MINAGFTVRNITGGMMPILVRNNSITKCKEGPGVVSQLLIDEQRTGDNRIKITRFEFTNSECFSFNTTGSSLVWLMPLCENLSLNNFELIYENLLIIPPSSRIDIEGKVGDKFVLYEVPKANRFFSADENFLDKLKVIDWSIEPVLLSEFDSRKRVYLASPILWEGIQCVKGEMIIYPKGGSAPTHHHENAEHFQIILKGSGSVTFDNKTEVLNEGDIIYFFENEVHSFVNDQSDLFIFAEFFIPGDYKTIWADQSTVCTWHPTGKDLHDRTASRQIAKHVAGQGTDI